MPAGTIQDFQLNVELFQTGATELLRQQTELFNASSGGAISLLTQERGGDFHQEAYYKAIGNLVQRRNNDVTTAVASIPLERVTEGSVKLNRRVGPIDQTRDSFKKIMRDPDEFSLVIGEQVGKAQAVDYVNTALLGCAAALQSQAALTHTEANTMNYKSLIRGMKTRGDRGQDVALWVMHSVPWYDLTEAAVDIPLENVAGQVINNASTASINRPVLVTDSPSLVVPGAPDTYITLGLAPGAITVEESEEAIMESDMITGLENLTMRLQGEHAFNVGLRGFDWDQGTGGKNPDDATLGAAANWVMARSDIKDLGGVVIVTQ